MVQTKLDTVITALALRMHELIRQAADHGFRLTVTSGFRSWEAQDELYARGRTVRGPRVTNARGGHSWHNFRRAADVWPVSGPELVSGQWEIIGRIGESLGLEWGGRFTSIYDPCHFQLRDGLSLARARELWRSQGDPMAGSSAPESPF